MRKVLLSLMLLMASFLVSAQTTIYSEDFESGSIPNDFTIQDRDGNTVAANISALMTDAWVIGGADTSNYYVMATSWYSPAGTSNDWLITPSINLDFNSTLSWKAQSPDENYRDGYKVYVINGADTTEVFSTNEEEFSELTERSYDLSHYGNSSIKVAFVNNSTDKFMVRVDDIKVTAGSSPSVDKDIDIRTVYVDDTMSLNGDSMSIVLENIGTDSVGTIVVSYTTTGQSKVSETLNFESIVGIKFPGGYYYTHKFKDIDFGSTGDKSIAFSIESVDGGDDDNTSNDDTTVTTHVLTEVVAKKDFAMTSVTVNDTMTQTGDSAIIRIDNVGDLAVQTITVSYDVDGGSKVDTTFSFSSFGAGYYYQFTWNDIVFPTTGDQDINFHITSVDGSADDVSSNNTLTKSVHVPGANNNPSVDKDIDIQAVYIDDTMSMTGDSMSVVFANKGTDSVATMVVSYTVEGQSKVSTTLDFVSLVGIKFPSGYYYTYKFKDINFGSVGDKNVDISVESVDGGDDDNTSNDDTTVTTHVVTEVVAKKDFAMTSVTVNDTMTQTGDSAIIRIDNVGDLAVQTITVSYDIDGGTKVDTTFSFSSFGAGYYYQFTWNDIVFPTTGDQDINFHITSVDGSADDVSSNNTLTKSVHVPGANNNPSVDKDIDIRTVYVDDTMSLAGDSMSIVLANVGTDSVASVVVSYTVEGQSKVSTTLDFESIVGIKFPAGYYYTYEFKDIDFGSTGDKEIAFSVESVDGGDDDNTSNDDTTVTTHVLTEVVAKKDFAMTSVTVNDTMTQTGDSAIIRIDNVGDLAVQTITVSYDVDGGSKVDTTFSFSSFGAGYYYQFTWNEIVFPTTGDQDINFHITAVDGSADDVSSNNLLSKAVHVKGKDVGSDSKDIELTSVTANGVMNLTGNTAQLTLTNTGTDSLSSVTLSYDIDGGTKTSVTIDYIAAFSGKFPAGYYHTYDFTDIDFPAAGSYTLNFYVDAVDGSADANSDNNIISKSVTVKEGSTEQIALVEIMTAITCGPCATYVPPVYSMIGQSKYDGKVVGVSYQGNYAQQNYPNLEFPMYTYQKDNFDGRATYYDLQGYPSMWLNGGDEMHPANLTEDILDAAVAVKTNYEISIDVENIDPTDNSIPFTVTYEATDNIRMNDAVAQVVLIERDVEYSTAPGTNDETSFQNVMRGMHNGYEGTSVQDSMSNGETITVSGEFTFDSDEIEYENLRIVAFLESSSSKSVAQANWTTTTFAYDVSTAQNEDAVALNATNVYPTVVSDQLTIEIASVDGVGDVEIEVVNNLGQAVGQVYNGQASRQTFQFDASNLVPGTYFINIRMDDVVKTQRVIKK